MGYGGGGGGGSGGSGSGGSGSSGGSGYRRVGDDRTANLKVNNITNRNGSSGTEINGIVEINSTAHFVPPSGTFNQRFHDQDENIVKDGLTVYLDSKYSYDGGNWHDLSNNSYNFSARGAATSSKYDYLDKSIIFNSSGDNYFNSDTNVNVSESNDLTVEVFVKPGQNQDSYANILDHDHSNGGWVIQMNSNNQNKFYFAWKYNSGDHESTTSITLTPHTWQHLVYTKNGLNCSGYLNGVKKFSSDNLNPNIVSKGSVEKLHVGKWEQGQRYFTGSIAIVRTYNRSLTDSEVLQNFNANRFRFGL